MKIIAEPEFGEIVGVSMIGGRDGIDRSGGHDDER